MITLARVGDVVKFTFQDNPLYLNNGTIEVPVNSLSLLIDESNIATFKKAASNDIFLSCSLSELGMSKEQLINWYKDNMVDEGITLEEVEDIVESATTNLFGYAEYDSQNTRINFKHDASGSVISSIDASDFVIDGMIDNVEIVTVEGVKYLQITFNTESGKEPILIPLADIFNPDNYYTKTATDALLAEKANTATTYTKTEVDNAISAATSGKADTSAVTEAIDVIDAAYKAADAAISGAVDSVSGDVVTEVQRAISAETALDSKIDTVSGNVVTSGEIESMIEEAVSGKVDTDVFDEKERAISLALNDLNERKQDTLVSGTNIKTINNLSLLGSGNIDIQGGGGKAVSAGTNISITTGETADTINCTLPITITNSDNNSKQSIAIGDGSSAHISNFYDSIAIGKNSKGYLGSIIIGSNPTAYTQGNGSNVAIGNGTKFYDNSVIIGNYAEGYNGFNANSVAIGGSAKAKNIKGAVAIGHEVTTTGTTKTNINNQLRIDTSNQVYIYNKDNTEMICLQDQLGGGSSYTAGYGIDITNDVISVTGKADTSAVTEAISAATSGKVDTSAITTSMTSGSTDSQVPSAKAVYDNFGGLKLVKLTQAQYNALAVKDPMALYVIADDVVCAPESDTWVTVDDNFASYNKRVYNLDLSGTDVYEVSSDSLNHLISFGLYSEPYTGQIYDYIVDVEFNNAAGEESYSLEISNTAGTIVYTSTNNGDNIDLCQILGGGFYLDGTAPEFTYCTSVECTEYECLEYDEETGECIEEGECITEGCTNEETAYPLQVKQ